MQHAFERELAPMHDMSMWPDGGAAWAYGPSVPPASSTSISAAGRGLAGGAAAADEGAATLSARFQGLQQQEEAQHPHRRRSGKSKADRHRHKLRQGDPSSARQAGKFEQETNEVWAAVGLLKPPPLQRASADDSDDGSEVAPVGMDGDGWVLDPRWLAKPLTHEQLQETKAHIEQLKTELCIASDC